MPIAGQSTQQNRMEGGNAKGGEKARKSFESKTRPITNLRRSNKSFLLPDFGRLLFSSSTFKSTTRSDEIGFPPTNNSRLSAILTEYRMVATTSSG